MSAITTHVLDTSRGRPAGGVLVVLDYRPAEGGGYREVGVGVTDADGRITNLLEDELVAGTYRLTFHTGAYFGTVGTEGFFPEVTIAFVVRDAKQHYHVPLLLSPHGYSTYRGS